MTDSFKSQTVAQIVRNHHRTAPVFKSLGINYCCGGNQPLEQACGQMNIPVEKVLERLKKVVEPIKLPPVVQPAQWSLHFLTDYICNIHHAYLKEELPQLQAALIQFADSHKKKLPELLHMLLPFEKLCDCLNQHTKQQEESLFPYIRQLESTLRRKESYGALLVKTLRKRLEQKDGDAILLHLDALRKATNGYTITPQACTNHQVIVKRLQDLDNDLLQHLQYESDILLPRAVAMEQSLLQHTNMP